MKTKRFHASILSVPVDAGTRMLKTAYKKLAQVHHPDKNQGSNESKVQFQQLNESFNYMLEKRKTKDFQARWQPPPAARRTGDIQRPQRTGEIKRPPPPKGSDSFRKIAVLGTGTILGGTALILLFVDVFVAKPAMKTLPATEPAVAAADLDCVIEPFAKYEVAEWAAVREDFRRLCREYPGAFLEAKLVKNPESFLRVSAELYALRYRLVGLKAGPDASVDPNTRAIQLAADSFAQEYKVVPLRKIDDVLARTRTDAALLEKELGAADSVTPEQLRGLAAARNAIP